MKFLVLNGPNINMLGIREVSIYGHDSYVDLCEMITEECHKHDIKVEIYQSNHEGDLVDKIQNAYGVFDGIIINAAAYSHTSIAILDALRSVEIPYIDVHISDVERRENYRHTTIISEDSIESIAGRGISGYIDAVNDLYKYLTE